LVSLSVMVIVQFDGSWQWLLAWRSRTIVSLG
jgi:hypothetical protein